MNLENKIKTASELFMRETRLYSIFNTICDVSGTDSRGKYFCLYPDIYVTNKEDCKAFVLLKNERTNADGEALSDENFIFVKGNLKQFAIDDRITYISISNAKIIEPTKKDIEILENFIKERIIKIEEELKKLKSLL